MIDVRSPKGMLMRKQSRQVAWSVKRPPSKGPNSSPMNANPSPAEVYAKPRQQRITQKKMHSLPGLFSSGTEEAMIVSNPVSNPDPPTPAKARPNINRFDEFATPEIKEPTSKIANPVRNDF